MPMPGGGIVHGPLPRDYARAPQEDDRGVPARRFSGLLAGRIHVIDSLSVGEVPSTKTHRRPVS
jgi:ribosomal protein L4